MEERLAEILEMAKANPSLRQKLLDTKKEKYPVHAFCKKIQELGYDISVGELIPYFTQPIISVILFRFSLSTYACKPSMISDVA